MPNNCNSQDFLVIQSLRPHASYAWGRVSIPGQRTRPQVPQLRFPTWCNKDQRSRVPQLRLSTAKLVNTYFKNNSKNSQYSKVTTMPPLTCFIFHLRLINVAYYIWVFYRPGSCSTDSLSHTASEQRDLGSNPGSLIPEHWAGVGTPWLLSSPKHWAR